MLGNPVAGKRDMGNFQLKVVRTFKLGKHHILPFVFYIQLLVKFKKYHHPKSSSLKLILLSNLVLIANS